MKELDTASQTFDRPREILDAVRKVVLGAEHASRLCLAALLAGGHVLIEDVPGVGKTTLAKAVARAIGANFKRIQFTSDLLPADIVGVSVFNQKTGQFEFKPGPVFAGVLLADEINRATPRTQSALLEAMSEGKVTVDGVSRQLNKPFFVIATQNPMEHYGTYPLPESQMDRFLLRTSLGYPGREQESLLLSGRDRDELLEEMQAVTSPADLELLQRQCNNVRTAGVVLDYILDIVDATRNSKFLDAGVSPRGALQLHRAAKAWAVIEGRGYVIPDDVQALAIPVLSHRVTLKGVRETVVQARREAESILADIVESVPVPV